VTGGGEGERGALKKETRSGRATGKRWTQRPINYRRPGKRGGKPQKDKKHKTKKQKGGVHTGRLKRREDRREKRRRRTDEKKGGPGYT